MPSPFPGMNPFLEDPSIWPSFHHTLADALIVQLNPLLGPKYYADVEVRTVIDEVSVSIPAAIRPDVSIYEHADSQPESPSAPAALSVAIPEAPVRRAVFVQDQIKLRAVKIYVTGTEQLVTSIEIFSPYNKRSGDGLEDYRRKRSRLLRSPVHLIEIDLLRAGQRPGREVSDPPLEVEYILLVNRHEDDETRVSEIWPVALNEALPLLPLPLLPSDPDIVMDLGAAVRAVHEWAGYDWRLNYQHPIPPPELRPGMAAWWKQRLAEIRMLS